MRTRHAFGIITMAAAGLLVSPPSVRAQATAGDAPAVTQALLRDIAQVQQKLIGLAEAMPEDRYGWRPGEGVRSLGEVMMHVAADNYFIPVFGGIAAPPATGITGQYPSVQAYENRKATKAETVQALREYFAHLKTAMEGTDQAFLDRKLSVFGTQMSGLDLWVLTATHLHEHLGQSIAYARSNGIKPPWSR